jgi:hypothetical protein
MQDFYINTKILCSSPSLCSRPTKAPPGPLSHSPPPLSPNQSPPLDPTHPKLTYTTFPLVIGHPSTTAPLEPLITLLQVYLATPRSPALPLARYQRRRGETLALLCKEEEKNAAILDPFWTPSLHRFTPFRDANLTLPSILIQEHWSVNLIEHLVRPSPSRTHEIHPAVKIGRATPRWDRRSPHVAPSSPRCRRRPRGEARRDPELARVSSLSPRPEEDDGHGPLIGTWSNGLGRSVPLRAPAPLTAGPGLSARLDGFPARAPHGLGRPALDQPGSGADLAQFFFREFQLLFFPDLRNCKNYRKKYYGSNLSDSNFHELLNSRSIQWYCMHVIWFTVELLVFNLVDLVTFHSKIHILSFVYCIAVILVFSDALMW